VAEADRARIRERFAAAVNMSADALSEWLETEQSRRVGWKADGRTESIGHEAGRRIAAILRKPASALDEDDLALMRKAAGFIARHRAQRPENIVTSRWRYSLMNWGHDPLKEESE